MRRKFIALKIVCAQYALDEIKEFGNKYNANLHGGICYFIQQKIYIILLEGTASIIPYFADIIESKIIRDIYKLYRKMYIISERHLSDSYWFGTKDYENRIGLLEKYILNLKEKDNENTKRKSA